MATTAAILNAIARLEERLVERLDERMDEWGRELRLDLDGRFDALIQRLDRMLAHSSQTPARPEEASQP